jgi:hypothetical protein
MIVILVCAMARGGVAEAGVAEAGVTAAGVAAAGVTAAGVTAAGVTEAGVTEAGVTEAGARVIRQPPVKCRMFTPRAAPAWLTRMKSSLGPWNQVAIM